MDEARFTMALEHEEEAPRLRQMRADFERARDAFVAIGGEGCGDAGQGAVATAILEHVLREGRDLRRFVSVAEIGVGGMGRIVKAWDPELRRVVAIKSLGSGGPARTELDRARDRLRLLEEAQVLAQLQHPGVLPLYEVGREGSDPFFTMPLVSGASFALVIELVHRRDPDWSLSRAVGTLLRASEAVAHAHERGVLHRDLKPHNIMVGPHGETYVVDWGLAKLSSDPRGSEDHSADAPVITSARQALAVEAPDSPLLSRPGAVAGTPPYMPPEQAAGEALDERSDVYSLGAVLYHLLSGHPPYHAAETTHLTPDDIIEHVRKQPPPPLHAVAPHAPSELVAICDKAMDRIAARRYGRVTEWMTDLRAYLEGRVVRAHRTGAVRELAKWVRRNRALAAALAAVVLSMGIGLVVSSYLAKTARQRTSEVLSLSTFLDLDDLGQRADQLWPIRPTQRDAYAKWDHDAHDLLDSLPLHQRTLASLQAAGVTDQASLWWSAQLGSLVAQIHALADPETGLMLGISPERGWGVVRRLRFLDAHVADEALADAWRRAIAEIADATRSPAYEGLVIPRQFGLIPIGRDPESGLYEFAHACSGVPPDRDPTTGRLILTAQSAIVLVLIPGGTFLMGSQADDPAKPGFFAKALPDEVPQQGVTLDAFFIGKYEISQGQWLRLTGTNPSSGPGMGLPVESDLSMHPVEVVSWADCDRTLSRHGLSLPTEAQWEYAARAGTTTPWWTGDDPHSLAGTANLGDRAAKEHGGPPDALYEEWLDDHWVGHAPIGTYRANPWGLHDLGGNVIEWCRDHYGPYGGSVHVGDGLRTEERGPGYVARGGGFRLNADFARSARRVMASPTLIFMDLGARAARLLEH
ncbi:MAG: bifunctional serine/threonine-protein kinase/formylglycine-generating enzyme family protein [Planctomycetota bacterium]